MKGEKKRGVFSLKAAEKFQKKCLTEKDNVLQKKKVLQQEGNGGIAG